MLFGNAHRREMAACDLLVAKVTVAAPRKIMIAAVERFPCQLIA
jgi:hypothetical protein